MRKQIWEIIKTTSAMVTLSVTALAFLGFCIGAGCLIADEIDRK